MSDRARRIKDKAAGYFAKGKFDKALLAWQEVVKRDPADLTSRLRLGDVYRRLEESQKAIACYREVAGFYARDGLLLKAIAACRLILEVDPSHTETQELLAELYSQKYGHPPPPERGVRLPGQKKPKAAADEAVRAAASEAEAPEPEVAPAEAAPPPPKAPAEALLELEDGDDEDEEILLDLDATDEPIDVSDVEPPPPPPPPEARELPPMTLFSDLDKDAFIALMEQMNHQRLGPGEVVVRQGEKGEAFYVVADGRLRVYREVDGEEIDLAHLTEGHFFGEMALLSDAPRSATVVTETDTELFELDRPLLERLTRDHPSVEEALERFYRQRLLSNLLATNPIFRPFDKDERRALIQRFNAMEVPAGEVVIEEGKPSGGLYLIMSGEVAVTQGSGFDETTLARLAEGDIFGEMSALTQKEASATVRVLRHGTFLRLPTEVFHELMMSHPQILEVVSELTDARTKQNEARKQAGGALDADDLLLV